MSPAPASPQALQEPRKVAEPLLQVHGLGKAFGGNRVLESVSFDVARGEILGLLGPNGSGKSTLLNVVSGFLPAEAGDVHLDGRAVTGLPAHAMVRRGIARTFQLPSMPRRMSVLETCLAASTEHHGVWTTLLRGAAVRRAEAEALARAHQVLDELLLGPVKDLAAASLSGGQKKLLSLACALMGSPSLLMLDEPTAGVHPNLRRDLVTTLQRINAGGVTLVIVEHDMQFVQDLCRRCLVLDRGRIVADCPPARLAEDPRVLEAYLGRREPAQPLAVGVPA